MDSFQDVLITVTGPSSNSDDDTSKIGYTYVLYNLPCDKCDNSTHRMLSAAPQPSGFRLDVNKVIAETPSYYGLFFDYDEIG